MDSHSYNTGLLGNLGVQNGQGAPLSYNGVTIRDQGEMLSLTDMWKATGSDPQQTPAKWRDLPSTKDFVEHVEFTIGKSDTELFSTVIGGRKPGTWAHWQIGMAYAKYLDHDFHMVCNQIVRERMEGKAVQRQMTPAEMFLHSAQTMVAIEQRQAANDRAMTVINERVSIIEQLAPLKAKPQAAETRSEIRKRMNQQYALSQPMVDAVLDNLPYSFGAFGMVKNSHEDAKGSSFPVYWIRDVTKLFKRFADECQRHSPTTYKHPSIARPFKMMKPESK